MSSRPDPALKHGAFEAARRSSIYALQLKRSCFRYGNALVRIISENLLVINLKIAIRHQSHPYIQSQTSSKDLPSQPAPTLPNGNSDPHSRLYYNHLRPSYPIPYPFSASPRILLTRSLTMLLRIFPDITQLPLETSDDEITISMRVFAWIIEV
ncbi:hypothetical protein AC579_7988 [Pseudocercospora musae]|uniref:Uncharacterized protein n=1 Tax=Pseudocercospora musae TaxID=113226 RepID=A0A139I023_9PEZI|nr:hypothetical protein AC579_7988 [Pseudocercospora musae]